MSKKGKHIYVEVGGIGITKSGQLVVVRRCMILRRKKVVKEK